MRAVQDRLTKEFSDAEYAHAYMGSHTVNTIAAQVYWTRKKRGWNQEELAKRAGMVQERISKIEAGDFTSLTMKTLHKLAKALDVNLRVEFEPFSHAVFSVCHQTKVDLELADRVSSLREMQSALFLTRELYSGKPIQIAVDRMATKAPVPATYNSNRATSAPAVTVPMVTTINLPQQRALA